MKSIQIVGEMNFKLKMSSECARLKLRFVSIFPFSKQDEKDWESMPRHGQVGWMPRFLPVGRGREGGNGLPQWSQSRPCNHIDITRKPRPCACPVLTGGGELQLGDNLISVHFLWNFFKILLDKEGAIL